MYESPISARRATVHDRDLVESLLQEAIDAVASQRDGESWVMLHQPHLRTTRYLDRLLDAKQIAWRPEEGTEPFVDGILGGAIVAGTISDEIFGVASAFLIDAPGDRTFVELELLYTEPDGRRVGVGHRMMEWVEQWAKAHGAAGIASSALPGDRDTKNFFEAHGHKAREIQVYRRLV